MHPLQASFRRGFSRPLDELRDELDRLWVPLTSAPPLHGWGVMDQGNRFPAVNLSENGDAFLVEAELPGLGPDQVDVSVNGEELVIRGSRPDVSVGSEVNDGKNGRQVWHRRERGTGSFERRLTLPAAIDAEHVEARLVDGVLRVTCPKAAEARPLKITVQAS